MSIFFALTNQVELREALSRYILFHHRRELAVGSVPRQPDDAGAEWVTYAFREVADWLEELARHKSGDAALREAVGFVDLGDAGIDHLYPIRRAAGPRERWASAAGLLVLGFPEVHWVLVARRGTAEATALLGAAHFLDTTGGAAAAALRSVCALHREGYTPLLDLAGLRERVRDTLREIPAGGAASAAFYVPRRSYLAAAVDDEVDYAYFNAYAAYRFGYRAAAVTSEAMTERLFALPKPGADATPPCREQIELTFEDLFLRFADQEEGTDHQDSPESHLSLLENRDPRWPRLREARFRIFVTAGHEKGGIRGTERAKENQDYLELKWKQEPTLHPVRWYATVYKPCSGLFDLWKSSELRSKLGEGRWPGLAPGFEWPVEPPAEEQSGDHSSPGRLHELADRLIARAGRLLKEARSVPDAIHGATLATDALEYLGNRTPTTSLAALSLKHQLEAAAESMFYGVEYHVKVKDRLREIEREIRSIGEWFRKSSRRRSELSAELKIVTELLRRFREHGQFDQEMDCLARSRALQLNLNLRRHWWTFPVWPFRWYIHGLLKNFPLFLAAIVAWIALLWCLFFYSGVAKDASQGFLYGVASFLAVAPPTDAAAVCGFWARMVVAFAVIAGFLNLGIFVAHLYTVLSRR
jgi:hypothetical protein